MFLRVFDMEVGNVFELVGSDVLCDDIKYLSGVKNENKILYTRYCSN